MVASFYKHAAAPSASQRPTPSRPASEQSSLPSSSNRPPPLQTAAARSAQRPPPPISGGDQPCPATPPCPHEAAVATTTPPRLFSQLSRPSRGAVAAPNHPPSLTRGDHRLFVNEPSSFSNFQSRPSNALLIAAHAHPRPPSPRHLFGGIIAPTCWSLASASPWARGGLPVWGAPARQPRRAAPATPLTHA